MPVGVQLFKKKANETLEGTTWGLEPEGATTSNASSDQQQLSTKGFQFICDSYKPVYCL